MTSHSQHARAQGGGSPAQLGLQLVAPSRSKRARGFAGGAQEAKRRLDAAGETERQREAVYAALVANPGLTSAELAKRSALDYHLVARRLPELRDAVPSRATSEKVAPECSVHGGICFRWTAVRP